MTDALGAEKGEGAPQPGSVYAPAITAAPFVTRVGKLELRVPQDRNGRFSTELFETLSALPSRRSWRRWPRCTCMASRPGRSRRSPRNCAATPSWPRPSPPSTKRLDESLDAASPSAPLPSPFPYLILDARYEKVREGNDGHEPGGALIAIGIRLGRAPP